MDNDGYKTIIFILLFLFIILAIASSASAGMETVWCLSPPNSTFKKDCVVGGLLLGATLSLIISAIIAYFASPYIKLKNVKFAPLMLIAGASLAILFSGLALSKVVSDIKKYQSLVVVSLLTLLSSVIIIILSLLMIFIRYRSSNKQEEDNDSKSSLPLDLNKEETSRYNITSDYM